MITPEINKYDALLFLDLDGVLNCQTFYEERYMHLQEPDVPLYKSVKKVMKKEVKSKKIEKLDYYKGEMCPMRMGWLNELCAELNIGVVLSASMRACYEPEELQEIFNYCGATFTIIDKTGHSESRIRGVEIKKWLDDNTMSWFGVFPHDFYRYAIVDDDSDMLLWQQFNFFQTDTYSGLTPSICYRIKRFLTHKTF